MNGEKSGASKGAMLATGGGLLAVIGVFLPWFSVSFSGAFAEALPAQTANGMSDWRGIMALIGGLVAAGAGAALISMTGRPNAKMLATLAGVAGIIVVLGAVFGYIGASNTGGSEEVAALEAFGASVDAGASFGLYLSAIGGLLAAIGGFMARGVADAGASPMMPPAAPAAPAA